jgi:hypothetical protein
VVYFPDGALIAGIILSLFLLCIFVKLDQLLFPVTVFHVTPFSMSNKECMYECILKGITRGILNLYKDVLGTFT